jgi:hypothetical protein
MKKLTTVFIAIAISASACTSNSKHEKWSNIQQNAPMLVMKDIEGYGLDYNYTGKNIGLSDNVIASFNSIGPSERKTPLNSIQGPIIRLKGSSIYPLDKETNELLMKAIKINADPSSIDLHLWQKIKEKYPSLTYIATTIFQISEEWKLSSEAHRLPYLWSSYIVARTLIIDINTRQITSEWRQEIQDRSTWERSTEVPERLAFYLKPIESIQQKYP